MPGKSAGELRSSSGDPPEDSGHSKLREVKGREVNIPASVDAGTKAMSGQTRRSPKYPHYPTPDCERLHAAWRESRGPIAYPTFRNQTAALYEHGPPKFSVDELMASIVVFGEVAQAASASAVKFWNVRAWVGDVKRWVQLGQLPLIDSANGTPTERGRLAAGLAAGERLDKRTHRR